MKSYVEAYRSSYMGPYINPYMNPIFFTPPISTSKKKQLSVLLFISCLVLLYVKISTIKIMVMNENENCRCELFVANESFSLMSEKSIKVYCFNRKLCEQI